MSDRLPDRPESQGASFPSVQLWDRFSADPRRLPMTRASDRDRDVAAEAINEAYGEGRLDLTEHTDRLGQVMGARTLGEMVPLLDDITIAPRSDPQAPAKARKNRQGRVKKAAIRAWLGLALLFNVIWVASWLFVRHGPTYYWPIWPMIGIAIPAILSIAFTGDDEDGEDDD